MGLLIATVHHFVKGIGRNQVSIEDMATMFGIGVGLFVLGMMGGSHCYYASFCQRHWEESSKQLILKTVNHKVFELMISTQYFTCTLDFWLILQFLSGDWQLRLGVTESVAFFDT